MASTLRGQNCSDGNLSGVLGESRPVPAMPFEVSENQPQSGDSVGKSRTVARLTFEFPQRDKSASAASKTVQTQDTSLKHRVITGYRRGQAQYFVEDLGNGIKLEMMLIPGGEFLMGSPKDEVDRFDRENSQHLVQVPQFFLGKYPVTQAQWRAIASEIKSDPSRFKGENRPVEQVSWLNAVEFCRRLADKTGRPYRLPSEAEWEYACRAGTKTPFHFGKTITTKLVNYNGNYTYGHGVKGEYREETTPVGNFPANAFGLYDMHGNVWEWCEDDWHENYQDENAPTDGSAWIENNNRIKTRKVLRGGSWGDEPGGCRSACRGRVDPGFTNVSIGFRVACGVARTL